MEGLERFLEAQDSRNSGYETAIREIKYSEFFTFLYPKVTNI